MSSKNPNERAQALKLRAKQLRREAYLAAKERHAKDPEVIAMKEAMKKKRREAYQQAKAKVKAKRTTATAARKAEHGQQHTERRAAADRALGKSVTKGGGVPFAPTTRTVRSPEEIVAADVRLTVITRSEDDPYGPN